jgi:hypothetical protein
MSDVSSSTCSASGVDVRNYCDVTDCECDVKNCCDVRRSHDGSDVISVESDAGEKVWDSEENARRPLIPKTC